MRLIQLAGAAGLALAGSAAQAETAPANVDRDLLAAIEDSMSDNPNIRGVCEGLAQAAAITGTGPISVAYPVSEGVTEDEMRTAVQACLDWDYSRSADTSQPNALIAPVTVTHVEFTDSGIRMTIAPGQVEEASLGSTAARTLGRVFGVTGAHAALPPESVEEAPHQDRLAELLGPERAEAIMADLRICLAEYNEIAEELRDMDEAEEAAETIALGEEDCGDIQELDTRIALSERRFALASERRKALMARQAAAEARFAELQTDTAELLASADRKRTAAAALRREATEIAAENEELDDINAELARLTIDRAICQAQGKSDAECGEMDERIDALQARGMAILEGEAEDAPTDGRTASLIEKDA